MKCNHVLLKETENGQLVYMKNEDRYQLSYKNLNFSLSHLELDTLYNYLICIDAEYWEEEYKNSIYKRKIPIPTIQKNFIILLDQFELIELQYLLSIVIKADTGRKIVINLPFFWN